MIAHLYYHNESHILPVIGDNLNIIKNNNEKYLDFFKVALRTISEFMNVIQINKTI